MRGGGLFSKWDGFIFKWGGGGGTPWGSIDFDGGGGGLKKNCGMGEHPPYLPLWETLWSYAYVH